MTREELLRGQNCGHACGLLGTHHIDGDVEWRVAHVAIETPSDAEHVIVG
jgi:hypothetical protein